jgi:hypothetical protein
MNKITNGDLGFLLSVLKSNLYRNSCLFLATSYKATMEKLDALTSRDGHVLAGNRTPAATLYQRAV